MITFDLGCQSGALANVELSRLASCREANPTGAIRFVAHASSDPPQLVLVEANPPEAAACLSEIEVRMFASGFDEPLSPKGRCEFITAWPEGEDSWILASPLRD